MTEEPQEGSTGAPFHGVTDWHAIDWESAHHTVRRLQARIVKATQEKRQGLCVLTKKETKPAKQPLDECCCSACEQQWWKSQRDGAN